jgi:hypothetical protein
VLTDFTTYDSVRAVLGLTARVLPDAIVSADVYSLALKAELRDVGESVLAGADLIGDFTGLTASQTLVEAAFFDATRLFAPHAVAFKALTATPELSPYYVTDSKAAFRKDQSRSAAAVTADYQRYRRLLIVAYAAFLGVPAPPVVAPRYLNVSSPVFDPVTGG